MALDVILGGIMGGVTRLVPEVMGYFDKKNERKHELAMGEQSLKVAEMQQKGQLALADVNAQSAQFISTMDALKAATEAQAKPTGIKWVDAFSAMIRPGVTVWLFFLYAVYKFVTLAMAVDTGGELSALVPVLWTADDASMLAAVLTFWFVSRTFERNTSRSFR